MTVIQHFHNNSTGRQLFLSSSSTKKCQVPTAGNHAVSTLLSLHLDTLSGVTRRHLWRWEQIMLLVVGRRLKTDRLARSTGSPLAIRQRRTLNTRRVACHSANDVFSRLKTKDARQLVTFQLQHTTQCYFRLLTKQTQDMTWHDMCGTTTGSTLAAESVATNRCRQAQRDAVIGWLTNHGLLLCCDWSYK